MTNPFAAAIGSIRGYLRVLEAYPAEHERDIAESHAAIRVLEAAGKIDEDDYFWAGRGSVSGNTIDLLAIILATLTEPDGGKK